LLNEKEFMGMGYSYVLKVKGVHQVGHVVATPLGHLLAVDALIALGCSPFLQELNIGGVVAVFGEDLATTGVWRDDVPWNTGT
jgi:hypothetical protein